MSNPNDNTEAIKSLAPGSEVTTSTITATSPQVEASGSAAQIKAQAAQPKAQDSFESTTDQKHTDADYVESEENKAYARGYNDAIKDMRRYSNRATAELDASELGEITATQIPRFGSQDSVDSGEEERSWYDRGYFDARDGQNGVRAIPGTDEAFDYVKGYNQALVDIPDCTESPSEAGTSDHGSNSASSSHERVWERYIAPRHFTRKQKQQFYQGYNQGGSVTYHLYRSMMPSVGSSEYQLGYRTGVRDHEVLITWKQSPPHECLPISIKHSPLHSFAHGEMVNADNQHSQRQALGRLNRRQDATNRQFCWFPSPTPRMGPIQQEEQEVSPRPWIDGSHYIPDYFSQYQGVLPLREFGVSFDPSTEQPRTHDHHHQQNRNRSSRPRGHGYTPPHFHQYAHTRARFADQSGSQKPAPPHFSHDNKRGFDEGYLDDLYDDEVNYTGSSFDGYYSADDEDDRRA